jgi:peptidyl-Lys metalloendopeptidase
MAGTLIYAASEWSGNGASGDYAHGQSAALALARNNPSLAIFSASNHEYFAENNPPQ